MEPTDPDIPQDTTTQTNLQNLYEQSFSQIQSQLTATSLYGNLQNFYLQGEGQSGSLTLTTNTSFPLQQPVSSGGQYRDLPLPVIGEIYTIDGKKYTLTEVEEEAPESYKLITHERRLKFGH